MPNLKARLLGGWLGDRLLREVHVEDVQQVGARFRFLRVSAPWLGEAPLAAGDKVQVFLPEIGTRTYSPFDLDADAGRFSLLAYLHGEAHGEAPAAQGDTPGASWAKHLSAGARARVAPGRSLPLQTLPRPLALFGDETSFGVARSLLAIEPAATVRLEISSLDAVAEAAAALTLPRDGLISRRGDDGHLEEVARSLADATQQGGTVVLTGRARSIQNVRTLLRASAPGRRFAVKAYWADGKRGLD